MYHWNDHMWGMHFFWWIFWILLVAWLLLVPGKRIKKDTPLNILQKRFARGEINKEEYDERKALLEKDQPGVPTKMKSNEHTTR